MLGSNRRGRKVIRVKREGREDTEGLSSPGTDSSGKAGLRRGWHCCRGRRWEDKHEGRRGWACAISDIRAILAQVNNYKLSINIFWLEIRWRSLSKVRSGYKSSSVRCNTVVANLVEEIIYNISLKKVTVLDEQRCTSEKQMNTVIDCPNLIMSEAGI